jgi:hypothetical protein
MAQEANEVPDAKVYRVVVKNDAGSTVSSGYVMPDRLSATRRLYTAEGWTVDITPVADADIPPHIAQRLS